MTTAKIELPTPLVPIFAAPRGSVRYRGAFGGRGSGKSFSFALMAAVWAYAEPLRVLATRELQTSIKQSFHAEVKNAIKSIPWLDSHYEVGESYIRGRNGSEFIFKGLRHNISGIKSMAQIDLAIVEEAEDVPEESWIDFEPTIRAEKSEIWCIWNPRRESSPVDVRFRRRKPADALIAELQYWDNPWFPETLEKQRLRDQELYDPATYAHVWEGAYLTNSNAQILANKVTVSEFEPVADWSGPYHGMDFGFAQDPTAAVKCWVYDGCLYVEGEAGRVGLEIDETAVYMKTKIPGIDQYTIRADSARPESISYLRRNGLSKIEGVDKWKGSVEDGIAHLRSYKQIVMHPRCSETIKESRLYSYKVDRLTGDVLPQIVDANNHYLDALRYAISPLIKTKPQVFIGRA